LCAPTVIHNRWAESCPPSFCHNLPHSVVARADRTCKIEPFSRCAVQYTCSSLCCGSFMRGSRVVLSCSEADPGKRLGSLRNPEPPLPDKCSVDQVPASYSKPCLFRLGLALLCLSNSLPSRRQATSFLFSSCHLV